MPSNYCERIDAHFWAEPLNAITNVAFLLAAALAARLLLRERASDWPAAILTALVGAIGIGSFLFHTIPSRWTAAVDVIPIQLFAFGYFFLAMRRFLGLRAGV